MEKFNNFEQKEERTDGQRMEDFAHTGDAKHLTPELARKMNLPYEIMKDVPGVTEEDLEKAKAVSEKEGESRYKFKQELYRKYNLDDESLKKLREQDSENEHKAYITHLLDISSMPLETKSTREQFEDGSIIRYAKELLEKHALETKGGVYNLMNGIRYEEVTGIRDVQVVNDIYNHIREKYLELQQINLSEKQKAQEERLVEALDEFIESSYGFLETGELRIIGNYLASVFLENFCRKVEVFISLDGHNNIDEIEELWHGKISFLANFNRDALIPFEIEKGKLALFSEGGEILYIADEKYSQKMKGAFESLIDQISYTIDHNANEVTANIPPKLKVEAYGFIEDNDQLGVNAYSELFSNKELLRDFLYLQKAEMRSTIEINFDIELSSLSIKEQIHFLKYLRETTIDGAEPLQAFTKLYGIDGMRTFLSLERGDESLGNDIVAFGKKKNEDVAKKVFKYYGQLLDIAEQAETLVQKVSECQGESCIQLADQVRENIMNRAQKDLEKAVRTQKLGDIEKEIQNYVANAKEYVALLQELKTGKFESIPAPDLSEEDKKRMVELLRQNYNNLYPDRSDEDFKKIIESSLEKSFSNPRTIFRILRDEGKIVSFNRFDTLLNPNNREVTQFGSFNADPAYSGIGSIMLEETTKDRLRDGRPMIAYCDPRQPISKKYIEDGFIATSLKSVAGKPSFEIWQSKKSDSYLESKKRTIDELFKMKSGSIIVREQKESETYPELLGGMGLTRYFAHEGKTYLVFEKLPQTLQKMFTLLEEKEEKKEVA